MTVLHFQLYSFSSSLLTQSSLGPSLGTQLHMRTQHMSTQRQIEGICLCFLSSGCFIHMELEFWMPENILHHFIHEMCLRNATKQIIYPYLEKK